MTIDGIDGFEPYMDDGFQKVVQTDQGRLSIRWGGRGLFTSNTRSFEVWYPGDDEPSGYQTAEDIKNYLKKLNL